MALDDLNHLIEEDEWFNIPKPVYEAITGIIKFNNLVTKKQIEQADSAHRKALIGEERQKKMEQ